MWIVCLSAIAVSALAFYFGYRTGFKNGKGSVEPVLTDEEAERLKGIIAWFNYDGRKHEDQ